MTQKPEQTRRARSLRQSQTSAEGLLWSRLRSKQLCKLRFRRQHPIGPFFADFACESERLLVELDGDYHDKTQENDLQRQKYLVTEGWSVIRFTNEAVLSDVEAVMRAIASHAGKPFSFEPRNKRPSGMKRETTSKNTHGGREPT